DEIVEALRARHEQFEHSKKPRVTRREEVIFPEARGFERRLEPQRELQRRQARKMLLVEPVELVGIEHSVAAADALESENVAQLLLRKDFLVARAGRPSEHREKVDHRFGNVAL